MLDVYWVKARSDITVAVILGSPTLLQRRIESRFGNASDIVVHGLPGIRDKQLF